ATGSFTALGSYDVGDVDADLTALTVEIYVDGNTGSFDLFSINSPPEDDVAAASQPVRMAARVLATTVTLGAITATSVPVVGSAAVVPAQASLSALSAPAPVGHVTARALAADVTLGAVTAPSR